MAEFKKNNSIMEGTGEWEESKHPRDDDGKFTSGQGGGKGIPEQERKTKQLEIINKTNPAPNNNLTWIRSEEDIKTFDEVIDDFGVDEDVTPDWTAAMIEKAKRENRVTVYSSYPIKNGGFVTPSKMEAQSYAGNNKIYSATVNLSDVAWIDEIQGQLAKSEN